MSTFLHREHYTSYSRVYRIYFEVIDAIADCGSSIYTYPVAGSSRDLIHNECTFSLEIIRTYPKIVSRVNETTRKTRISGILTDKSEKNALALEQSKKRRRTSVPRSSSFCNLGVVFDVKLCFVSHIQKCY